MVRMETDEWFEQMQNAVNARWEEGPPFDPNDWFENPLSVEAHNLAGELWCAMISGTSRDVVRTLVAHIWGVE